jgi:hypothetical protein
MYISQTLRKTQAVNAAWALVCVCGSSLSHFFIRWSEQPHSGLIHWVLVGFTRVWQVQVPADCGRHAIPGLSPHRQSHEKQGFEPRTVNVTDKQEPAEGTLSSQAKSLLLERQAQQILWFL